MAKAVKMADIAKVMGVSTVTVSKALSDQKGVSEELRAKIKRQAEEMGYKTAQAVSQERAKTNAGYNIGVLVSDRFLDKYDAFYLKLYQEVTIAALQRGCFTMLEILSAADEERRIMPKLVQEKKAEGLVIIGRMHQEYLQELEQQAVVPLIYLDFRNRSADCDAVVSDSYSGMYAMTNYLFEMGHRDIAFVGNVLFTESITDRYFGYVKALYEHGIEVNPEWVINDRNPETGRSDRDFEWKLPAKMPTAFVCNNDVAAARLVSRLEQEGYRVPQDISVVGYDNYQPPGLCDIRITTYEVDMQEMARHTVKKMIRKLSGENYKQSMMIVSGKIVYKESVARHI